MMLKCEFLRISFLLTENFLILLTLDSNNINERFIIQLHFCLD